MSYWHVERHNDKLTGIDCHYVVSYRHGLGISVDNE